MSTGKRPMHIQEIDGHIVVRKGGEVNIGDYADTITKAKGLDVGGVMNISSRKKAFGFLVLVPVLIAVVKFIFWLVEYF